MSKDWNVPWPDGSWLTWNEETESWEKHEGPPPEERPRKKPTSAKAKTTETKPAASGKAATKKTTAKKTTAKKTTAKKTTAKKTTAKKATDTTDAAEKGASWEPAAESMTKTPIPTPPRSRTPVSTETSAWRPVAEGLAPVAEAAPQPVPDRSDAPAAPRERPPRVRERTRRVTEPGETSILPAIVSGCVVGVLAGYFLSFLIR